jgi:hypothetical protein
MQLDNTKAAPNLSIRPFQVMRMMEGMRITIILARRLRHWVVRSARRRFEKTEEVDGNVVAGAMRSAGCNVVVEVMVEDMVFFCF